MRNKVLKTGRTIQQHLIESEDSIDKGLIAQSMIAATLLSARLELGLRAQTERELVAEAGAMLAQLFAQRERVLDMHARFGQLAIEMKIAQPRAFGDSGPSVDMLTGHLAAVPAAA